MTPTGIPCSIKVEIGHRQVTVLVWQVRNGRMSLYLIDTDVPENTPEDRALSARLYGGAVSYTHLSLARLRIGCVLR